MKPTLEDPMPAQRLAWGLIAVGILARLLPHPWNVTPVTAIALFGGAMLSRRWAIGVPLATIAISDLVLGWHEVVIFTWSGVVITGLLGLWLRRQLGLRRVAVASLAGSTIFFLLTNFGVWLVGGHGAMYPKTLAGLTACYVAALPFYRNALIGDLVYSLGVFALYAWCATRLTRLEIVRSS